MKIGACYIRVSTDDQGELSPDTQLLEIQKYAKQHGIILNKEFVFVDEGISGKKAKNRPAFQEMIGTAKKKPKPFDVILLWKFSRFSRNQEEAIVYKGLLRKDCGIEVISITAVSYTHLAMMHLLISGWFWKCSIPFVKIQCKRRRPT